ncbi:unnamed protein product [Didymodactylos carnosus]|uniref:Uncharacterized protein n=1 Tax=Didymodactylos carnosus TaxID=1234261 RepID=A0A814JFZ6_9BILA|nr:unnamed protein product [Didymodactylos carnosus]CAF1037605.1 unnamed protein product [Didymodactylos carnosus]CAF3773706.1 unnamed protein product [Didymodactylos carnosus]CAF3808105.1 unnamed protein product [Didymodactylos carnosus]
MYLRLGKTAEKNRLRLTKGSAGVVLTLNGGGLYDSPGGNGGGSFLETIGVRAQDNPPSGVFDQSGFVFSKMDAETTMNFNEALKIKYDLSKLYRTDYIHRWIQHMCSNLQLDPIGFGIFLPSVASVLCGYTSILRNNQFPNATTIYSILVAMPTYGKSTLFSVLRRAVEHVQKLLPTKFYDPANKQNFVM